MVIGPIAFCVCKWGEPIPFRFRLWRTKEDRQWTLHIGGGRKTFGLSYFY